ncbi:MAG: hypothetical protein KAR42_17955 [candidate division Zixibacteria bacterium]|nr:hypothetical protein [candidate division Zixibacteria bacterium]
MLSPAEYAQFLKLEKKARQECTPLTDDELSSIEARAAEQISNGAFFIPELTAILRKFSDISQALAADNLRLIQEVQQLRYKLISRSGDVE